MLPELPSGGKPTSSSTSSGRCAVVRLTEQFPGWMLWHVMLGSPALALLGHILSLMRQSPVTVLVTVSLLAASSLTLQTPTDRIWSPGIYDGDALDDAIALLSAPGEVAAPPGALILAVPGGARVGLVARTAPATSEVPASLTRHFRSPPLPDRSGTGHAVGRPRPPGRVLTSRSQTGEDRVPSPICRLPDQSTQEEFPDGASYSESCHDALVHRCHHRRVRDDAHLVDARLDVLRAMSAPDAEVSPTMPAGSEFSNGPTTPGGMSKGSMPASSEFSNGPSSGGGAERTRSLPAATSATVRSSSSARSRRDSAPPTPRVAKSRSNGLRVDSASASMPARALDHLAGLREHLSARSSFQPSLFALDNRLRS